jgi:hypothetical protein
MDDFLDNCELLYQAPKMDLSSLVDTGDIDADTFDFGSNTGSQSSISFVAGTINLSITLSTPSLTHNSLLSTIAGLNDRSATTSLNLVLGATNLAKLSTAEKATITAKNWTYS